MVSVLVMILFHVISLNLFSYYFYDFFPINHDRTIVQLAEKNKEGINLDAYLTPYEVKPKMYPRT